MGFIDKMIDLAKADKKTIVLPEPMDRRTFEAAEKILKLDIANLVIIGTPEEIEKYGAGYDISGAKIVDPFKERLDLDPYLRLCNHNEQKQVPNFYYPRIREMISRNIKSTALDINKFPIKTMIRLT